MRAMRVGVRYRSWAIWQATIFTSSLLVRAMRMSVSAMPAASSTEGYEALPATARTSMRSWSSRSAGSLTSTTVTSLAGSRARAYAALRPTWPTPRISIFMIAPLHSLEPGDADHQPLGSLLLEIDMHARVWPLAFEVEYDPLAEFTMPHARAQAYPAG